MNPDNATQMLQDYLSGYDARCPSCTYNLRDLTGTRCPECNQELALRVGLAEPRWEWFIGGVIGIAMGLGFSSMLLLWACASFLTRGTTSGSRFRDLLPLLVGTLVGVTLMSAWVHSRRMLAGAFSSKRWMCMVAVTLAALASPLWFFAIVR